MIRENDDFLMIQNDYIKGIDTILDGKKLTILALIHSNLTVKSDYIFSINYLLNALKYKNNNKKALKNIKDILKSFIDENILNIYINRITREYLSSKDIDNINKNDVLYADEEEIGLMLEEKENIKGFTILNDEELYNILNIAEKYNLDKFQLIQLVLYIFSCINNNNDLSNEYYYLTCYPSINNMEEILGLSHTTIEKYIKILKENKIIYYDYAGYVVQANGNVKNTKMVYSRYKDKDRVIEIMDYERKDGIIKYNKLNRDKSNLKRKLKQTINVLSNKEEELTKEEIIKLKLLNDEYKKLI